MRQQHEQKNTLHPYEEKTLGRHPRGVAHHGLVFRNLGNNLPSSNDRDSRTHSRHHKRHWLNDMTSRNTYAGNRRSASNRARNGKGIKLLEKSVPKMFNLPINKKRKFRGWLIQCPSGIHEWLYTHIMCSGVAKSIRQKLYFICHVRKFRAILASTALYRAEFIQKRSMDSRKYMVFSIWWTTLYITLGLALG